jgi:transcriptional/translational regulatory protein YebC/TACO1
MFDHQAVVVVDGANLDEDTVMMTALDAGADDVQNDEGNFVIFSSPDKLHAVCKAMEGIGANVLTSEVEYIASNTSALDGSALESVTKLIDALEDLDDVQNVYTNLQEE